MKILLSAMLITLLSLPALACAEHEKAIDVDNAFSYATSASQTTGAVFMEIENGSQQDRLIAVTTPVAAKAELHTMSVEGGVMQMRTVAAYNLPADGDIELSPSGNHIMLTGMKGALKAGDSFPLTLTFEKQGPKNVTVKIVPPGTSADEDHDMEGHHH